MTKAGMKGKTTVKAGPDFENLAISLKKSDSPAWGSPSYWQQFNQSGMKSKNNVKAGPDFENLITRL